MGEPYWYRAKLIRVVDGDAVSLDFDAGFQLWLRGERCRLAGINTPEIFGKAQPGGAEAKAWLENQIAMCDGDVLVRTEKSKDKFGRWLVWIYPPGSCEPDKADSLNLQMVRLGLAKAYSS